MNERRNKRLMQLVRHVHGLMDIDDTQKNRNSQDHLGSLYAMIRNSVFGMMTRIICMANGHTSYRIRNHPKKILLLFSTAMVEVI